MMRYNPLQKDILSLKKDSRKMGSAPVFGGIGGSRSITHSVYLGLPGLAVYCPMYVADGSGGVINMVTGSNFTLAGDPKITSLSTLGAYMAFDGTADGQWLAHSSETSLTGGESWIASADQGITVMCWARFGTTASHQEVMISKDGIASNRQFALYRSGSGYAGFYIFNSTTSYLAEVSSNTIGPNEWVFVVGRFDPSTAVTVTVYHPTDGRYSASETTSIPSSANNASANFQIGYIGATNYLEGDLAHVACCRCHLSDSEIEEVYGQTRFLFDV